jgi:hypothetical protein
VCWAPHYETSADFSHFLPLRSKYSHKHVLKYLQWLFFRNVSDQVFNYTKQVNLFFFYISIITFLVSILAVKY